MLRLMIEYDSSVPNPLTDCDGQWTHYSFLKRRGDHTDPARFIDDETGELNADLQAKLNGGLAFWLDYYEHGAGSWLITGNGPKCRRAGLLVWENAESDLGPKSYEDRKKDAEIALATFNDWCNGHCYRFSVERVRRCEHCGGYATEDVESCGGFVGEESLFDAIREVLDRFPDEEVEIAGNAAWLVNYEGIRTKRPV